MVSLPLEWRVHLLVIFIDLRTEVPYRDDCLLEVVRIGVVWSTYNVNQLLADFALPFFVFVLGKMSLQDIRKLYFELKAEVFTKHGCSTKNQEAILKKCVSQMSGSLMCLTQSEYGFEMATLSKSYLFAFLE